MYASSRITFKTAGTTPGEVVDAMVAGISTEWFKSGHPFAAIGLIEVLPTPHLPEMQSYCSRFVSRRPRCTEEKAERIES